VSVAFTDVVFRPLRARAFSPNERMIVSPIRPLHIDARQPVMTQR